MQLRFLAILVVTLLTGANASAAPPATTAALDLKRIEAVADGESNALIAAGVTPGMTVAVAKDGEVVFARGYGKADVKTGAPSTVDTVYKIGSVTKQFTAAAIMRLVDAKKVAL